MKQVKMMRNKELKHSSPSLRGLQGIKWEVGSNTDLEAEMSTGKEYLAGSESMVADACAYARYVGWTWAQTAWLYHIAVTNNGCYNCSATR
jgi:hypothetical protein